MKPYIRNLAALQFENMGDGVALVAKNARVTDSSVMMRGVIRSAAPYVLLMNAAKALVMICPEIALWLPETMLDRR